MVIYQLMTLPFLYLELRAVDPLLWSFLHPGYI